MLTRREHEILAYCAVGFSAKETADRLFISPETVRKTIANIKIKTGLQKVAELTAFFLTRHLKVEHIESLIVNH